MALGALQTLVVAGTTPTYAAPATSQDVDGAGTGVFLHIKNTDGSPITVTLTDPGLTKYLSHAINPTFTVAATTGDKMIPLPTTLKDPTTGKVHIAVSAVTGVTAALIKTI